MTEKIIFPTPRISKIFTEHLKFVCTFFCSCYTKSFNFNSAHIEFPARKFISLQQGRFSTRHHIRFFGPLRQKVSISYADQREQPEKWRMLDWNSIWEGGLREILVAPFGATQKRTAGRLLVPQRHTKVEGGNAAHPHPSSFCGGVRGRRPERESPTNLITATRQNSPRSWLQEATRARRSPKPVPWRRWILASLQPGVHSSILHSLSQWRIISFARVWFKSIGRSALPQK